MIAIGQSTGTSRLSSSNQFCTSRTSQRLAVDQLEDEPLRPACFLYPVDRSNVRMVERGQHVRLTLEPGDALGVGAECGRKNLDGHLAPELQILRAIHLADAAGTERSEYLVEPSVAPESNGMLPRCGPADCAGA